MAVCRDRRYLCSHRIPSYLRPRGGSGRTRASSPPTPDASHTLDKLRRLSRTLEDLTLFDDALGLGGVSSVGDPWTLILNPNADAEAKSGVLLEVAAAGGSSSSGGGSLLSGRSGGGSKEGQKEGKRKEKFDEWEGLSTAQVWRAAQMEVIDTEGKKVKFGSLFEEQRTICCFIRHFWCPFCQDYLRSIVDNAPPAKLDKAGVKLIIVSNGSHKLAKAYQENVFKCPYPIYVDPSRELYRAFGMTRCTINGGPESEKGAYVVHGPIGGLGMALRNAMKMPLGNAGDIKQLGGEFILGPGIRCEYAHRMPTTRGHVDIRTLLSITRVDRVSEEGERSRDKLEVDIDHPRKKEWDALMRWKEKRGKGKWELFDDLASEEDMVAPYDCSDQDQACDTEEDGWGKRTMRDLLALIPQDPDVDEVARHESSPLMATSAG
ncbi:AhpC/TSA antioxidant enzyme-domain-containing protein [Cantharellus anzutake]|uniref:AhpC/TSA antioxidant enzyme-domain-containing protein n=1 Tax=Cantharellus anzutake TaxID=1750568 RepID=UPI00190655F0|nr:AhpC/TSA antioxidant enzyme-domain-containing protein [Cantharellus anzutake]KAF8339806.1 AhpC/TSA antioxidant enzyme-domain-containing protein [Cantharellus anzutake]